MDSNILKDKDTRNEFLKNRTFAQPTSGWVSTTIYSAEPIAQNNNTSKSTNTVEDITSMMMKRQFPTIATLETVKMKASQIL